MKAVVTGASGFIGRNLVVALQRAGVSVAGVDVDAGPDAWRAAVSGASVVYHLAGVNRPPEDREFFEGNVGSLDTLFAALDAAAAGPQSARALVVLSSSTQADKHNPYGRSKLAAEQALEAYAARTGSAAVIYRLPGASGNGAAPITTRSWRPSATTSPGAHQLSFPTRPGWSNWSTSTMSSRDSWDISEATPRASRAATSARCSLSAWASSPIGFARFAACATRCSCPTPATR